MKANRKFRTDDDAVSPVIAVILMVAITVVLAATVYVWVSGFGSQSSQPAKTISLTSATSIHGAYHNAGDGSANGTDQIKNYTVASASPGMKYSDVKITLDGATVACEDDHTGAADQWRVNQGGSFLYWIECTDTGGSGPSNVINAGDTIELYDDGGSLSGKSLRILDSQANSVILTLVVG